jgi:hypothetical protein
MPLEATKIFPSEENLPDIVPLLFSPPKRNHARSDILTPLIG